MPILKVANIHFNAAGTTRFEYRNDNVIRANANSFVLPISSATTANDTGAIRYNSSTSVFEGNNGSGWQILSGVGSAYDKSNLAMLQANTAGNSANAWANTIAYNTGNAANARANTIGINANNWANTVGTSANTFANGKFLANTTGTFGGSLTLNLSSTMTFGNDTINVAVSSSGVKVRGNNVYLLSNTIYLTTPLGFLSEIVFPTDTRCIEIEVWGSGGGGGGVNGIGSGQAAAGCGGGGGYSSNTYIINSNDKFWYSIGAGGAGGVGASFSDGSAGTSSSFGVGPTAQSVSYLASAGGGSGGAGMRGTVSNAIGTNGAGGAGANGKINIYGDGGTSARLVSGVISCFGKPGSAPFIGPGLYSKSASGDGAAGKNYGEGGQGGFVGGVTTNYDGGNGANGLIKIVTFI